MRSRHFSGSAPARSSSNTRACGKTGAVSPCSTSRTASASSSTESTAGSKMSNPGSAANFPTAGDFPAGGTFARRSPQGHQRNHRKSHTLRNSERFLQPTGTVFTSPSGSRWGQMPQHHLLEWRNWYTRKIKDLVVSRPWGFESPLEHYCLANWRLNSNHPGFLSAFGDWAAASRLRQSEIGAPSGAFPQWT